MLPGRALACRRDRERRDLLAAWALTVDGQSWRPGKTGREQDSGITEGEVREALVELDPLWDAKFP